MPRDASADHEPAAAGVVTSAVTRWRATRPGVLVLAIDGHGGSGKSTIAAAVAEATGAALVHTDDFFRPGLRAVSRPGGGPGPEPGARVLEQYYDWRRLRAQALDPLRAGRGAEFRRFDWDRGRGLDGTATVRPSGLIVVEGVFSASPELADQVNRSVLVDTPEAERLRRLHLRVAPEEWDDEWLAAERAYFRLVRPPSSFDLVVPGTGPAPRVARE
jgi:uridine kinase